MSDAPTMDQPTVVATPWPLAGTSEFERTDPSWRQALIERYTADLTKHAIQPWFPRCVDRSGGGFWEDFDRGWRRRGDGRRMLEFQARQTRSAARLGLAFPSQRERWATIAGHGLRYLSEVMADENDGGWFWLVDRDGHPLHAATKHAHGISYVVSAAAEVYRLTGDEQALAMARAAVDWLERVHHDEEHGGYHGWVTREGKLILGAGDVPAGALGLAEPLGHGIGLKDTNVNSDVLESYTLLASIVPDRIVRDRLNELADVISRRLVTAGGALHYMTYTDWSAVPTVERFGYAMQLPPRLLLAAGVPGVRLDGLELAYRLTDHVLAHGWDEPMGIIHAAGPGEAPKALDGHSLVVRHHEWWAQTEGLRTLTLMALLDERPANYRAALAKLLAGIERHFIDERHGGWHSRPITEVTLRGRLRGHPYKGNQWKDASHEVDACLMALRMLRGLPAEAPLE